MGKLYIAWNGPMPTTAAQAPLTTGTAIKTHLQLKPANVPIRIVEWGVSFDASAAATPVRVELVDTGTVFATVTAYGAADVMPFEDPNAPASNVALGTSASGYAGSAEGTITAVRTLGGLFVSPMASDWRQLPLGREPEVKVGNCLRIRITSAVAYNAYAYCCWEE